MNIFALLLIRIQIHWSLLTNGQKSVELIDCTKYESCFNTTIHFNDTLYCDGAQSCIDCNIDAGNLGCEGFGTCSGDKSTIYITNNTWCDGANSCSQGNITSDGQILCDGYNTCSNGNVQLTSYLNPLWQCPSTHSCSKSVFKSDTSYSHSYVMNTRFIRMYFYGVFNGYNTTIYNNGNDIYILSKGYYSLYGLTLYCTSIDSICIVSCYGNGCVGLTLICGDSVLTCQYKCNDKECESYTHLLPIYNDSDNNFNDNDNIKNPGPSYDEIATLVNDILTHYDKNFTLFPDNNVDLIKSNEYCGNNSFVFGDYKQVSNKNNHVCCLGAWTCQKIIIDANVHDSRPTVYCGGLVSCSQSIFSGINSVYSLGGISLYQSNVTDFGGIVVCSATISCWDSFISNGSVVVCMSAAACSHTTITNIQIVIAMGYNSLLSCQLTDVEKVMLLGTQVLSNTTISSVTVGNFELYCQNDDKMCDEIGNITSTPLYCYDETSVSLNIDGIDFNAVNVSNLVRCSTYSYSPSMSPTIPPTESQLVHDIDSIVSWLETSTAIVGIILIASTIILIFLSIYFRKKKHSQTMKKYIGLNTDITDTILLKDVNNNDNLSDDSHSSSTIMTYTEGFGHKASHLVIVQVTFEVFDVFIDVSYLLELYHNNLLMYFWTFLSSCIFILMIDSIILLNFLKTSFKYNKLFEQWFWNHSAIIISLMIFCLFTDVGMIISLFTSQIFGHLIFYAPLNLIDIKTMKTASILSIFIEHLPQLIVQCLAYFNQSESSWSAISITSLSVTCIDTFITCIKIIIWFVIMKQMKVNTK